jgi:hypothetical protein
MSGDGRRAGAPVDGGIIALIANFVVRKPGGRIVQPPMHRAASTVLAAGICACRFLSAPGRTRFFTFGGIRPMDRGKNWNHRYTQMHTDKVNEQPAICSEMPLSLVLSVCICVYLWFQIPIGGRSTENGI